MRLEDKIVKLKKEMVGYNVQTAVDAKHHLIVAHEVTNVGHDRIQLANMAMQAKEALDTDLR